MNNQIISIGHIFSLEDRRSLKIEYFLRYIQQAQIKTVVDLRTFNLNSDTTKNYHPAQLKIKLKEHDILYISIGEKISEFYSKYNSTLLKDDKIKLLDSDFCKPIIDFINTFDKTDTPVGLLFRHWETSKTWKGLFSKHVLKNHSSIQLNHLAPGESKNNWEIFTNSNLFNDGYGSLLSLAEDMNRKYRDEYDENDWGYTSEDLDEMYRDAYNGNPEAEWNND